ncbi:MAG: HupE/UreJ family protein [Myxococcaceae bacterium]|nr:HupE/UreJ family protein [Myxococcaceae bacterium]
MTLPRVLSLFFSLGLLWLPRLAAAHPLSPPTLSLHESTPGHYEVEFRRSALAAPRLRIDWPSSCRAELRDSQPRADQVVDRLRLVCTRSLPGQTLRAFGLLELELSMLIHLELANGERVRALLSPAQPSLTLPRRESSLEVLRGYTGLGISHLLGGADHLLFVLGLMLLVRALPERLFALTAFTLGHSLTLCLSALSVIALPQAPVEVGIAASLVVLALDVLHPRVDSRRRKARVSLMATGFGLLHGLGFASALRETGLPAHAVPLALLGFNLGVELGQLLVVLALAQVLYVARRLTEAQPRYEGLVRSTRVVTAYAIGALAAMWCLERAVF